MIYTQMSQPQHPKDTQALLQSMLQRLKLQTGRESKAHLNAHEPITTVPTWGQDGEGESPGPQSKNSPVNDGKNGMSFKEFTGSTADTEVDLRGGQMNGDVMSSHSHNDNINGETGENRVLGQDTQPGVTQTGGGQLFPAGLLKDADIASSARTDGETVNTDSSSMTENSTPDTDAAPKPNVAQVFTPRVYVWSLKNTDNNTGSQENKGLHVGNGELGALAHTTANSSFRTKQRAAEKKSKRWTTRIKERWKDRQGSKKEKEEEGTAALGNAQATELQFAAPHHDLPDNPFNMSNKDGEETLSSLDTGGPSEPPAAHTGDSDVDGPIRSVSDFELGLGSFSLLEEIVKGQEWAKFLNPNVSAAPVNPTPSQERPVPLKAHSDAHSINQPPGLFNHVGAGSDRWSFRSAESPMVFTAVEISPDDFQPASMDVSEENQQQRSVQTKAEQSEPMEDGQNLSDMQPVESEQGQMNPPTSAEPAARLQNVLVRSRLQLNRKRHHQPAERTNEMLQADRMGDGEEADRESSSPAMDESAGSRPESVMASSHLTPQSPSFSSPTAPAPRGVLKHSISRDSESSMETLTKRRRVEENRHVRFSEEVVTIETPDLDVEITDSEEDSEEDEEDEGDTVTERDSKVEHVPMEEAAPARRAVLPNWILALKRRNTGKKPR